MASTSNPFAYVLSDALPDWRDPNAYPDPSVASLETWAIEFMARNPDFKREAKQLFAVLDTLAPAAQNAPPEPSINGIPIPVYNLSIAANSGIAGLLQRYGAKKLPYYQVMRVPTRTYADLFGHAYELINRQYADLARLRGEPPPVDPFIPLPEPESSPEREFWILPKEHAQIAIRFNLEYPLELQIAAAAQRLKHERERLEKEGQIQPIKNRRRLQRVELYRTYLRLLDAKEAGASVRQMAEFLYPDTPNDYPDFPGDQAVRGALKAAKKIRDHDYRNLPLREK